MLSILGYKPIFQASYYLVIAENQGIGSAKEVNKRLTEKFRLEERRVEWEWFNNNLI